MKKLLSLGLALCALLVTSVASSAMPEDEAAYHSTYQRRPSTPTAIVGATILTAAGPRIGNGTLLIRDGKIVDVGNDLQVPAGFDVVDASGKWITPGIIDPHVHLGTQVEPNNGTTNELTNPNSANVWIEHGVWPQAPGFAQALAAGVTVMQILPGSGALFGGRGVVVRPIHATSVAAMKMPQAPQGLKMACGENPSRVFGEKGQLPSTIMGTVAGYRAAWTKAREYDRKWREHERRVARGEGGDPPERDLKLDTLRGVLQGEIPIHMHCYRADEMVTAIQVAHEFGFRIAAFHHAPEAYKIAPLLAKEGICAAVWAQPGPAKMEMSDIIPENAAILERAGACVSMHSDGPSFGEHLPLEASIAMAAGNRAGLGISREEAVRWFTLNPARMMGIDNLTGSLEAGKAADLVVWNTDPFSVYALPDRVYVQGALMFDRSRGIAPEGGDLELGRMLTETK